MFVGFKTIGRTVALLFAGTVLASATSRTALTAECGIPAKDLVFAPTFPPDGALLNGSDGAPDFTWRPGGFDRFHVEFSSSPDFSRHPVRETAGFRSPTRYTPGERIWTRVQEIGRCGRPVYWRVVAKIPGALGVVSSDRLSWFAFKPPVVRIEMAQSRPSIDTDGSRGASPVMADIGSLDPEAGASVAPLRGPDRVTFRVSASSSECRITESRIDFDGDGWWDASTAHGSDHIVATYDHSYPEPGTFTARAEILTGIAPLGSASEIVSVMEAPDGGICSEARDILADLPNVEEPELSCSVARPVTRTTALSLRAMTVEAALASLSSRIASESPLF